MSSGPSSGQGHGDADDDTWDSSSARQIRSLGHVEKDLADLLQIAANMLSHQRIPSPGEQAIAQDEWEGLIAREAVNYFDKLDAIQKALRRTILDMRARRMTPTSLNIAALNALSTTNMGSATLPPTSTSSTSQPPQASPQAQENSEDDLPDMNFQEARLEHDTWIGLARELEKLKTLRSSRGSERARAEDADTTMEDAGTGGEEVKVEE